MDAEGLPLPPGTPGLPWLGETLVFLRDGFGFVEERARRHGPVFRTRILGRETAVIVGPEAAGLFVDGRRVQREGAMPPHVQALFGGRSLPALDGDEHRERKQFVLAAFTRDAMASYVPTMQRRVRAYLGRWCDAGEVRWLDEFKRLAIETICETVLGLAPGPTVDRLREDYDVVGGGFAGLPLPLPGTAYTRARAALARILAVYRDNIREHQAHPRDDGLSRMLAARTPDGRGIAAEHAAIELHHIIVAGLIVWAWLVTAVAEIGRRRDVRERLAEALRGSPDALTPDVLDGIEYLGRVGMEVRRTSPVVHVFFGKACETLAFAGHRVPAGWMVLWGHRSTHLLPAVYAEPERFDPDRFAPGRAEHRRHEHAFVPNGAGPPAGHKCAGYEFAPCLLHVLLVELVRACAWDLPDGLAYDWSRLPPEPRGGLRARVRRLASAGA